MPYTPCHQQAIFTDQGFLPSISADYYYHHSLLSLPAITTLLLFTIITNNPPSLQAIFTDQGFLPTISADDAKTITTVGIVLEASPFYAEVMHYLNSYPILTLQHHNLS